MSVRSDKFIIRFRENVEWNIKMRRKELNNLVLQIKIGKLKDHSQKKKCNEYLIGHDRWEKYGINSGNSESRDHSESSLIPVPDNFKSSDHAEKPLIPVPEYYESNDNSEPPSIVLQDSSVEENTSRNEICYGNASDNNIDYSVEVIESQHDDSSPYLTNYITSIVPLQATSSPVN